LHLVRETSFPKMAMPLQPRTPQIPTQYASFAVEADW
jgi:hypothetical protein